MTLCAEVLAQQGLWIRREAPGKERMELTHLLYIEDEPEIGEWVTKDLTERGYRVTWLTSGEGIGDHLDEADLVILDVMLPGLDGFSLGRRIKREHGRLPILMLSARSAVEDKLEGLDFADDYVTKPFHPDELAARVEVLLRRYDKDEDELTLHHLTVSLRDMRVLDRKSGEEIVLTPKQYQLFRHLIRNRNRILTKEQLYEAVWNQPYLEGDKTLMVHIRHLREKIERDPANPVIIETIRGIGYRVMA